MEEIFTMERRKALALAIISLNTIEELTVPNQILYPLLFGITSLNIKKSDRFQETMEIAQDNHQIRPTYFKT